MTALPNWAAGFVTTADPLQAGIRTASGVPRQTQIPPLGPAGMGQTYVEREGGATAPTFGRFANPRDPSPLPSDLGPDPQKRSVGLLRRRFYVGPTRDHNPSVPSLKCAQGTRQSVCGRWPP
jgi:hypothetical protein